MSQYIFKILTCVTIILLFGCSQFYSENNGTGSNAGDADVVAVYIIDPAGKPAVHAKIQMWNMSDPTQKEYVAISKVQDNGVWSFKELPEGIWLIEASQGDSLLAMRMFHIHDGDSFLLKDSLKLKPPTSIQGVVLYEGLPHQNAKIQVLDQTIIADQTGSFIIEGLAPGNYLATLNSERISEARFTLVTGVQDTIEITNLPYIVLENFEYWNYQNNLGDWYNNGWWYYSLDDHLGGNSLLNPSLEQSWDLSLTESDSKSGTSFHVSFEIDESFSDHYALVGFHLGYRVSDAKMNMTWFDLSGMTAISFWAKGTGAISLQLIVPDDNNPTEISSTSQSIQLQNEWTLHRVLSSTFNNNLKKVNAINFMGSEDLELWIDDIKLEGISPVDWVDLSNP
jgi:hypothetical protein